MTLVSSIIKDAYRESNLIAAAADPNTTQSTEALNRLNPLIQSTIGLEAGDGFVNYTVGTSYDDEPIFGNWLPDNARLYLNLAAAKSYSLDPRPYEGQRLAVTDISGNLGTYNVTLSGNGRLIEGAASLVLNTNSLARQWMYRADTGNWVRISTLTTSDEMPFPVEFDDYFVTMLAIRLNPRYGQEMHPATMETLRRTKNLLRARYYRPRQMVSDVPTRGLATDNTWTSDNSDFDTGMNNID